MKRSRFFSVLLHCLLQFSVFYSIVLFLVYTLGLSLSIFISLTSASLFCLAVCLSSLSIRALEYCRACLLCLYYNPLLLYSSS